MPFIVELIVSAFVLAGAGFALIGAIGLARMPDFFMRVHLPTAGTTLGVGCTLIGSAIYFSVLHQTLSLHEFLISMFLFITAPVSSHMMSKVALHLDVPYVAHTQGKPWPSRTARPFKDNSAVLADWQSRNKAFQAVDQRVEKNEPPPEA